MIQFVGKSTWGVFLLLLIVGYFWGYFESHIDLLNHSITSGLWFDQGKSPLWNATGFLLPALDCWVNKVFGEFDFYALAMVFVNSVSLSLMFWSLFKLSSKLEVRWKYLLAISAWLVVATPQIMTLNSTRIAITGTFSVLLFMSLNDNWRGMPGATRVFFVLLFTSILALIRMEAVVLIGVAVGVPLFAYYNWSYKFLSPVVLGLVVMVSYNLSLEAYAPESMKVYYYYEHELIDRENVCVDDAYSRHLMDDNTLTLQNTEDSLSLQATALIYHSLPTTGALQTSFMLDILCLEKTNRLFDWLLGGINLESWWNCFQLSIEESKRGLWALAAALFSLLGIGFAYGFHRITFYAAVLFLVPALLMFHIALPARFVVPYYTCYSSICLIFACLARPKLTSYAVGFGLIITSCLIFDESQWIMERRVKEDVIKDHITGIRKIVTEERLFVVLQTNSPDLLLPQKVRVDHAPVDSVLFMDEYFTYRMFYKDWELACNCNPKSLTNRLQFAAETDAAYISTEPGVVFSSKYTKLIHNVSVSFKSQADFGNSFIRYRVQHTE